MLWSNVFQCKIPHIDAQHKALFDHIEKLGSMHGDISRIPDTLDFLETYVDEHFCDEQSLHEQARYPRALEHRRQHQLFVQRLHKMREDYMAVGHNLATLMEMNHAVVEWLKAHILGSDKAFALFYHELPDETKQAMRLPHRPWIPESSQSFYHEVTGTPPPQNAPAARATTKVFGSSWSDALLCGIPAIDDQHKELFRQLDILRDRGNRDRIPKVLRFLGDYVIKHFNDEESLHLKSAYPHAADHRKLHTDFIATFKDLKAKYDSAPEDLSAVMTINKVVYEWLREHVMKVDKAFGNYYAKRSEEGQNSV